VKKRFFLMICIIGMFFLVSSCTNMQTEPKITEPEETTKPSSTPVPARPKEPEKILLASAETELIDKEENRLHNIHLATGCIDGYSLRAGESFSFNEVVGRRTAERGYRDATILVNGEKELGCGGGVCQVSTTLYQAVRNAGLNILEQKSHQKEVPYAAQGDDAAVNYGTIDLRFLNNTEGTIQLYMSVDEEHVTASIYEIKSNDSAA